jgi:hypothetical protein
MRQISVLTSGNRTRNQDFRFWLFRFRFLPSVSLGFLESWLKSYLGQMELSLFLEGSTGNTTEAYHVLKSVNYYFLSLKIN